MISNGNYTIKIMTYNNGNLVNSQTKSISYVGGSPSGDDDPEKSTSYSLTNMILLFLSPLAIVVAIIIGNATLKHRRKNHDLEVISGIMESECRGVIQEFFLAKRD